MEKVEYRAVIKFLHLKGKTNDEIKSELDSVYGNHSPSIATVKRWTAEFRRGRTSIFDEDRPGRPKEATTQEIVEKIHDIVLDDPKVKVRELAEAVGISTGSVVSILHNDLGMRKLTARWVPRLLTIDQKRERVRTSQHCLDMFKRNPADFLRRIVTIDETWIHHYTPESKESAKQWVGPGGSAPKRPKTQQSAGKVMASVFWDSSGILFIDYLEKGKTINSDYYCALLDRLKNEIAKKRPHLSKKKCIFLQDNAPAHKSIKTMAKLHELRFELLLHPPYSPDLAPSDYYLFPNFKRWLQGQKFATNEEVQWETDGYFGGLDKSYYSKGIAMLENRWTKCIELKGDYVEE